MRGGRYEGVAKLLAVEKTMILSQFASREATGALPPSTYLDKVAIGGGVAK